MESRVSTLEKIMPMLATREDLAKHSTAIQEAIYQQTWKIITWVSILYATSTAITIFITTRTH